MTLSNQMDLLYATIDEISGMYRRKEVSPVEVMKATLERLDEVEPQLNAFITVLAEQSLVEAKKAEEIFRKGEAAGKLTGIPISLKDIFSTKGIRTSMGSRILKDFVPEEDAYVYKALREAGAILFGKTNMLEFAFGFVHPDYGQTNNPWNVKRVAGGSSTGSGASVSAGIGYASIGTDTGGSIRAPGSFCGIIGLKPTYDLIPRTGCFPLSDTLDHVGLLTRTVKDNAIILEAISLQRFHYESIFTGDIDGVKVGIIRSLTDNVADPQIKSIVLAAIAKLGDLGAELLDVSVPFIENAEQIAIPILLSEASKHHAKWYEDRELDYSASTFANLKAGYDISAVAYLAALEQRRVLTEAVSEILTKVDVLVCPTFSFAATEKDPSFEQGNFDISSRTIPFNLTGHPALTVSAGNTISEPLPVGLEIIGRHLDESMVYRVAYAFEAATGGFKRPPL
ncbi:amidase [Paenibacillus sp. 19GGS1-52]|uniref:amidase n=1 Tax=Paenibacillus sp. 19GGS1-52 TaxID=2758563 RepID=UPI001EFAECFE|nr:amidase [Paenibacillus sp. 19GGS1-52]ULO09062.1 amidase [Paenibacillus sp. 19GGS1-52]